MFDVRLDIPDGMDCYAGHQHVLKLLRSIKLEDEKHLFCIDPIKEGTLILRISNTTAKSLGPCESLPDVFAYQTMRFCMRVSPVVNYNNRRIPIRTENQPAWCKRSLSDAGSHMIDMSFKSSRAWCGKGTGFSLPDVVMIGELRIVDPQLLLEKMKTGIGRHRAFGFGLLQLFP